MTNENLNNLLNRLLGDKAFEFDGEELSKKAKKRVAKFINEYFGKYLTSDYADDEDVINDVIRNGGGKEQVFEGKDSSQVFGSKRKQEESHPFLKRAAFVAGAYYLYKQIFKKK